MWYRPDGGSVGPGPLLVGNIRAARSSVCTQRGVRRLVGIPAGLGLRLPYPHVHAAFSMVTSW
jgi:hypothetical protein